MVRTIAKNIDAGANKALTYVNIRPKNCNLIVPCTGLAGTLDAVVTFYGETGGNLYELGKLTLDAANNAGNVHRFWNIAPGQRLAYKYDKNGCTGGTFDVIIADE